VTGHAEPGAEHMLMPRQPGQPFDPPEPGISKFDCLLRMQDGETIVVHLRFENALFDALPARRRALRWTTLNRDGYLWVRDHAAEGCPICAARPRRPARKFTYAQRHARGARTDRIRSLWMSR